MGGILYSEGNKVPEASLKYDMFSNEKKIYDRDGKLAFKTEIVNVGSSNVKEKKYVLMNSAGVPVGTAYPEYAEGEDPDNVGWPVAWLPVTDHAKFRYKGEDFTLIRQNSQYYVLNDETQKPAVSVVHRGITGGWNLEASRKFSPEILLAVFVFCRNIESENDLIIV